MPVIFDMDGVLVDTQQAVVNAYEAAGIAFPPYAWGEPWQSWLPGVAGSYAAAVEAHDKKNEIYPEMIHKYARRLSGAKAYRLLDDAGMRPEIITSASSRAVMAVEKFLGFSINVSGTGMTRHDKEVFLSKKIGLAKNRSIVYVDDSNRLEKFCEQSGIQFCPYQDHVPGDFLAKVLHQWTLLSSLPVEMTGLKA